jgi:hypothetical protein
MNPLLKQPVQKGLLSPLRNYPANRKTPVIAGLQQKTKFGTLLV